MKKSLLMMAALALSASVAQAGVITYTLVQNDVNSGGVNKWGLYATDSVGDNAGIAALQATLLPTQYTGTPVQQAPRTTYTDSSTTNADFPAGFQLLRSLTAGKLTASEDTIAPGYLIYGYGQTAGDFTTLTPNGYDGTTAPITQASWGASLKILSGTMSAAAIASQGTNLATNWFSTVAGANSANLFTTADTPANQGSTVVAASTVNLVVTGGTAVVAAHDISLSVAALHTVAGTVVVASSGPNRYAGAVLTLGTLNTGINAGSVKISDIGNQGDGLGPTEVLLWLKAGFNTGDEALLQADLTAAGNGGQIKTFAEWGDQDATNLAGAYGTLGGLAGITSAPTYLVRFPGIAPSGTYNDFFNFTLPNGDTLVAITAVPEPASLGLLALGGLGLIARRRSTKR